MDESTLARLCGLSAAAVSAVQRCRNVDLNLTGVGGDACRLERPADNLSQTSAPIASTVAAAAAAVSSARRWGALPTIREV